MKSSLPFKSRRIDLSHDFELTNVLATPDSMNIIFNLFRHVVIDENAYIDIDQTLLTVVFFLSIFFAIFYFFLSVSKKDDKMDINQNDITLS